MSSTWAQAAEDLRDSAPISVKSHESFTLCMGDGNLPAGAEMHVDVISVGW